MAGAGGAAGAEGDTRGRSGLLGNVWSLLLGREMTQRAPPWVQCFTL